MNSSIVRIQKIEIKNLKNVGNGTIQLLGAVNDKGAEQNADILGIYGQNGSGKTTVIYALEILKVLLMGNSLESDFWNYIKGNEKTATCKFELSIVNKEKQQFKCIYEFGISKEEFVGNTEIFLGDGAEEQCNHDIFISMERLSVSKLINEKWTRMTPLLGYSEDEDKVLIPLTRYKQLTEKDKSLEDEIRVGKLLAKKTAKSFLFSKELLNIVDKSDMEAELKDMFVLLRIYSIYNLHVISNAETGVINANIALPISFVTANKNSMSMITAKLKLDGSSQIPKVHYEMISSNIKTINMVLEKIIPGLSIELKQIGITLDKNSDEIMTTELVAQRGKIEIPLKYESDGIKKLVSILYILIMVYNNPSTTLAVDEFDSGIFEYLLGEILCMIEESGKGQLIFTSHNLRPLEVINKNNILFTTTNENNRYIKFKNVKTNNNFRDMYFHDILLGGQNETIYEMTSSHMMRRAFRMAGDVDA